MDAQPKKKVEVWGGIECTINRVHNTYFNQLDQSGHRKRGSDISLFAGLGIKKMRYPVLWEQHQAQENLQIDWRETEQKLNALRSSGIDVIAGLVHHGSGPLYAPINEESFAVELAAYAAKVAKKFPWINYYTPVNEPLTTARFCGLYGHWFPHQTNDASFCRILVNECKATASAMIAIRLVNPGAKFVQTDDLAKVHSSPTLAYQAEFENHRRWLSFDLLCGHINQNHVMWNYLLDNDISEDELFYFNAHPCPPDILGINYYLTSERYLDEAVENYPQHTHGGNGRHIYADIEAVRVNTCDPDGLYHLLKETWERYHIPIAVTEVHLHCTREEQMRWLNESWLTANKLKDESIGIVAITPWALLGSFGWDHLLTTEGGSYESGVFDCSSGYPRPTLLTAMIKTFALHKTFKHTVLEQPGWWKRASRIIYGEKPPGLMVRRGKVLAVSGYRSHQLIDICQHRCLNTIATKYIDLGDTNIWAKIIVGDYMEIKCAGRVDLVISLAGDIDTTLNAGLDLLIDCESGHWATGSDGKLKKQSTHKLPVLSSYNG